jgi:anaerobic magnesium-protoporphyrin IX monomethyl ester cyclase
MPKSCWRPIRKWSAFRRPRRASWMPSRLLPISASAGRRSGSSSATSMSPRLARPILEHFPEIDCLVIGEGEGAMLDLADGKPLAGIGNLIWRNEQRPDRRQSAPRPHCRPRRTALPGLRKTGRFPARLPPAAVRLRKAPRGDDDHLARLPLHLLVLRPHGFRAAVQDQFGAIHLRPHEVPARQLRGLSHQHVRRPVHRQKAAGLRPLPVADRQAAGMQWNCAIRTGHTSDEMLPS